MPVGLFDTFYNHQNLVLRLGVDFAAMSQGTPRQKVPRPPLHILQFSWQSIDVLPLRLWTP